MPSFQDLTTAQLRQILQLREQIETAQQKLDALLGGAAPKKKKVGKRTMSAATIAKMRAAQQARWAHLKAAPVKKAVFVKTSSKKKVMSPEAKAKIAAAMKARWDARKKGSVTSND